MDIEKAARLTDAGDSKAGPHFFRVWMPYLIQRVTYEGVKHAYLPLNRDYKPLGMSRGEWVDYDACALSHGVAFKRDPATFDGVWHRLEERSDQIVADGMLFLYSDNPDSRRDYFVRFERLMAKAMPLIQIRDFPGRKGAA